MLIGLYLVFFIVALFILAADSFGFIVSVLGFTIMGLLLNVEIVTPYVAFLIVVITNVCFCYANVQRSYMEVKGYILKCRQQESDTTDSGEQNTIPEKLFWSVSDQVLPVKNEICRMFGHIALIVTFLFLTISSIIFFENEYDISTVVSTIAVHVHKWGHSQLAFLGSDRRKEPGRVEKDQPRTGNSKCSEKLHAREKSWWYKQ